MRYINLRLTYLQQKPDGRMYCDDIAGSIEADDQRQIADWHLQRLAHSSLIDTAAPCLETSVDRQSKLVQDLLRDVQPVQLGMQ